MGHPLIYFALEIRNNNNLNRVYMENLVSLMILLSVFTSLMLLTAYVTDAFACKCIKWLGLEDVDNEQKTPTIRLRKQVKYVEGNLFE